MSSTRSLLFSTLDNDVLRIIAQYLDVRDVLSTFLHLGDEIANRVQPNWFSTGSLVLTLSVMRAIDHSARLARLLANVRHVTVLPRILPPTQPSLSNETEQARIHVHDAASTRTLLEATIRLFHTIEQLTLHRVDLGTYLQWDSEVTANQSNVLCALRDLSVSFALKFRFEVPDAPPAEFVTREWMLSNSLQRISLRGNIIHVRDLEALLYVPSLMELDLHISCLLPVDFDLTAMFLRHSVAIRRLRVIHLPIMQHEGAWEQRCDQLRVICAAVPELCMDNSISPLSLPWTSLQGVDNCIDILQLVNIFALPNLHSLQLRGQTIQDFRTVYGELAPSRRIVDGILLPSLAQSRMEHLHLSLTMPVRHHVIDDLNDPITDSDLLAMFLSHLSALMTLNLTLPHGSLWNDNVCDTILTYMPHLQSLHIVASSRNERDMAISNDDVDEFASLHSSRPYLLLPSLRIMSFSKVELTDVQLSLLLAHSPALCDVQLSQCASLSVLILFALAQYSPHLARIRVEACSNVRLVQEDLLRCEMRMAMILSFLPSSLSESSLPLTELIHLDMYFPSMDIRADPTLSYPCELDDFGVQWLSSDLLTYAPLRFIGLASTHLRDSYILGLGALQSLEVIYWPQLVERQERENGYVRAKHLYEEGFTSTGQSFTTSAESQMIVTDTALLQADEFEGGAPYTLTHDGISLSFLRHCSYYGYRMFVKQQHQQQHPSSVTQQQQSNNSSNNLTRAAYFHALALVLHSNSIS